MKYIIGIDQSTQGTKALVFDEKGEIVSQAKRPHCQIVNEKGWISHDPLEIWNNVLSCVREAAELAGAKDEDIFAVGISNQRETSLAWDKEGNPIGQAVVWQCARAEEISARFNSEAENIHARTGLRLSPYFPAAKWAWLNENIVRNRQCLFGTIDSWLLFKLTEGKSYKTDFSNASRTQLFNLQTLKWDNDLCRLFGIGLQELPEVCASDSLFGYTDFAGSFQHKIPIYAVLGDSHAALYAQGCHEAMTVKATYGTGSSVMMNVGNTPIRSRAGLVSSIAWKIGGTVNYVLEGNINYTGAAITWLKDDLQLIESASETEILAKQANPSDSTVLVPAFSGLSAPYWKPDARAVLCNMSRTTGRAEIVKAVLESIAFQVTDVLNAMSEDCGGKPKFIRCDGAPSQNGYLMQRQSDFADLPVLVAERAELSAMGAAYLAGQTAGVYETDVFRNIRHIRYGAVMPQAEREQHMQAWHLALKKAE